VNAHLATVDNDLDALFLGEVLRASSLSKFPYIGYMFNTFSQKYQWTAGSSAQFANWAEQPTPSSDTACTVTENGRFVPAPCNERRPYVCTAPGGIHVCTFVTQSDVMKWLPLAMFLSLSLSLGASNMHNPHLYVSGPLILYLGEL
jgi:hypothetical protein